VKAGFLDPEGDRLEKDIRDIGITTVKQARVSDVYLLEGELDEAEVTKIGQEHLNRKGDLSCISLCRLRKMLVNVCYTICCHKEANCTTSGLG
jgi:hypothetical protein